ncbi:MAG: serine/threonine-protein phosphatase [Chloroflexi bacterium]|nr:serine/threonine-protein phosphatase [Chloroflexota bacterium]MBP8057870.1 serine/threonine-protein phosphatase [Chloroflexota bacterium]
MSTPHNSTPFTADAEKEAKEKIALMETKPLFPPVIMPEDEQRLADTAPLPQQQRDAALMETIISKSPIEAMFTPGVQMVQRCHVGAVRRRNEDSCCVFMTENGGQETLPGIALFVVADGMGGHYAGHEASRKATRLFMHHVLEKVYLPLLHRDGAAGYQEPIQDVMLRGVQIAHQALQNPDPEKDSGTTLTAALMVGRRLHVAHVGDTRTYLLADGVLEQVTTDHSVVQRLVDAGQLTADEAVLYPQKNLLYRALGQQGPLDVDTYTRSLPKKGTLFLCSDGLWGLVPDGTIRELLLRDISLDEKADALVELAIQAGGHDNITVVIVDFVV